MLCSGGMLKLLERVGTAELAERFVREILPKEFDGSEGKPLHRLCRRFGWEPFAAPFRDFLAQQKAEDPFCYSNKLCRSVMPSVAIHRL